MLRTLEQNCSAGALTLAADYLPDEESYLMEWEWFSNAFFFMGTICTTVGYGNFAPQTDAGKMFTAFFAFFGTGLMG